MVMGSRMMEKGAALRGNMPQYKYYGNKVLTWDGERADRHGPQRISTPAIARIPCTRCG
jgi:hypothetical protein